MDTKVFRTQLSENIFNLKYRHDNCETWEQLVETLVDEVVNGYMSHDEISQLKQYMKEMKFLPGGRYLYYAGRPKRFYNNCYLLRCEEDTREDWATLSWKAESCLITGGGIGVDYSIYRPEGSVITRTGGRASGPIPKALMVNEIGRRVMQGGARRSAIYASLNWEHDDIHSFLHSKNWHEMKLADTGLTYADIRHKDFDFPCPLDMTNISVNYDTKWLLNYWKTGDTGEVFKENVKQAMTTGEPGFSFNFFDKEKETLRNACTEVTSEDDSDVCNLGSVNMSRIDSLGEFIDVVRLSTKFLLCGTLKADLPYAKVRAVREKNRRLGLGLMGIHEWLLKRNEKYEVTDELRVWLDAWRGQSSSTSKQFAERLNISTPVANRAIAPTGTIAMLAGTTTGIEPLYAVAYKRRYLTEHEGKSRRRYQYHVDHIAQLLIDEYGLHPENIESAIDLSRDIERRVKFQADVQDYTDMAISSTINLPNVGNGREDSDVTEMAELLGKYAHRLRGLTFYPDGARGGQPLESVPYTDAVAKLGEEFEEGLEVNDVCEITGGGYCGL